MQQEDGKMAELPCGVVGALLRHLGAGEVAAVEAVGGSRRVFNLGAAVDQRCVVLARRGKWDGRSTLNIDGHGAYGVIRSRDHVADLGVGYETC